MAMLGKTGISGAITKAIVVAGFIFLWVSDYTIMTKFLGTLGLFCIAILLGWYGAAFRSWYRNRRNKH